MTMSISYGHEMNQLSVHGHDEHLYNVLSWRPNPGAHDALLVQHLELH